MRKNIFEAPVGDYLPDEFKKRARYRDEYSKDDFE
jgi:hypothetical protein